MGPRSGPPHKAVGLVTIIVTGLVDLVLFYTCNSGAISHRKSTLTMLAPRAGLVMDPGSKVTFNGVEIGRVSGISVIDRDGTPVAKVILDVTPAYVRLIPANVTVATKATTVFGNKYVALSSPKAPAPQLISSSTVIDATSVTTEFKTLFDTLTSVTGRVDPVKLNLTTGAAAQALTGLGEKFGASWPKATRSSTI
jgi:phospholipid/cholesterol/gamma-HCH transport system substrate-binding protein